MKKIPLTKELLHELYWVKELSIPKIARKTDRSLGSVRYWFKREGVPIRGQKEARRLRSRREVERARQCVELNVPELLKDLEVEYTKDGRIKTWNLPPVVRERLKDEALRLREIGGWGARIVAKALGPSEDTVNGWYHLSPEANREQSLRWWREHREEMNERARKKKRRAREDLVKEFGGRCQRCRDPNDRAFHFHHLERAKEDGRKGFMDTSLGRLWMRSRKTKRREEVLKLIWEKVMLLGAGCHNEVTTKEWELGRRLSHEEILRAI